MGSYDDFVSFSSKLAEECLQSNSFDAISGFNLISVHIGPYPVELVMTFESSAPDGDSDLNAVRFSVVFEGIGDLSIRGLGSNGSVEVDFNTSGGYNAIFHSVETNLSFRFRKVKISGVRRFKMARKF